MSEERAGYGGARIRVTWTLLQYPDEKRAYDYDLGISALEFANVKELRIERLPDEPAAPHVGADARELATMVQRYLASSSVRFVQTDAELERAIALVRRILAAPSALVAAAQPAPAEPPMRYSGMEMT